MSKHLDILQSYKQVVESYENVGEWRVWIHHDHIGSTEITIRIDLGSDGKYHYSTSHYYQGSNQAGPYISSRNSEDTVEQALESAMSQLLSFFKNDDDGARWIEAK